MRQPVCPDMSRTLYRGATAAGFPRVFSRGTYLVTDGPRFESPAEVDYMKRLGGDIIGQSMAPEVFLARDIGACFAGIYLVVNYGEGIVRDWAHEELKSAFFNESATISSIVVNTIAETDLAAACGCMELRKPSLLNLPDERGL
jgi:5'-methylthioadenosine phosphorylase